MWLYLLSLHRVQFGVISEELPNGSEYLTCFVFARMWKELWEFFFSCYTRDMPHLQNPQVPLQEPQRPQNTPQVPGLEEVPPGSQVGPVGAPQEGSMGTPQEAGMDYWDQGAEAPYEQQLSPEMLRAILEAYYGQGKQAALQKIGIAGREVYRPTSPQPRFGDIFKALGTNDRGTESPISNFLGTTLDKITTPGYGRIY